MKMNKKGIKILRSLLAIKGFPQKNKIAEETGLSIQTVTPFINKMIDDGIVKGFSAIIEPDKLGYHQVHFLLNIQKGTNDEAINFLKNMDRVLYVTSGFGNSDCQLVVAIPADRTDLIPAYMESMRQSGIFKSEMSIHVVTKSHFPLPDFLRNEDLN